MYGSEEFFAEKCKKKQKKMIAVLTCQVAFGGFVGKTSGAAIYSVDSVFGAPAW